MKNNYFHILKSGIFATGDMRVIISIYCPSSLNRFRCFFFFVVDCYSLYITYSRISHLNTRVKNKYDKRMLGNGLLYSLHYNFNCYQITWSLDSGQFVYINIHIAYIYSILRDMQQWITKQLLNQHHAICITTQGTNRFIYRKFIEYNVVFYKPWCVQMKCYIIGMMCN